MDNKPEFVMRATELWVAVKGKNFSGSGNRFRAEMVNFKTANFDPSRVKVVKYDPMFNISYLLYTTHNTDYYSSASAEPPMWALDAELSVETYAEYYCPRCGSELAVDVGYAVCTRCGWEGNISEAKKVEKVYRVSVKPTEPEEKVLEVLNNLGVPATVVPKPLLLGVEISVKKEIWKREVDGYAFVCGELNLWDNEMGMGKQLEGIYATGKVGKMFVKAYAEQKCLEGKKQPTRVSEEARKEEQSKACVAEKENLLWQAYEAEFRLKGLKAKKPAWLRGLAEKVCHKEINLAQALAETLRRAKVDIAEEIYQRVVRKRPVEEVAFEKPGEVEVVEEPEEEIEVPVEVHGRKEEVPLEELPELEKRPIPPKEQSVYERLLRALDRRLAKLGIELDLVLPDIEPELKALAEAVRSGEMSFDEAVIRASAMAKRRYEALREKAPGEALPEVEVLREGPKVKTATEVIESRREKPRSTFEYLGRVPEWLMEALDNPRELGEMLFYGAGKYLKQKADQHPDALMYVDFLAKWLGENIIQPTARALRREYNALGGLPLRRLVALYVLENYGGRLATGGLEEAYKYAVSWVQKLLKDCNTPECKFARRFASSHFVCTKIGDFEDVKVTTTKLKGYACTTGWYYLTMTAVVEALKFRGGSEADLPMPYRWEYERFMSAMVEAWSRRGR